MARPTTPPRLLAGPYTPPSLRRGDRTTCLFRDGDVVITGWSDAPIPWPRCRLYGTHGGGSGILLDEELARAVRTESAAAVCHWWGVTPGVVWRWRKALGVGLLDSPGTRQARQAAAVRGGRTVRDQALQRRRALGLPVPLVESAPEVAPPWSAAEDDFVRTLAPQEAACRTGRPVRAVYGRRQQLRQQGKGSTAGGQDRLGRHPPPARHRWSEDGWKPEEVALLGTMPDEELARQLGRSVGAVGLKRRREGIPNPRDRRRRYPVC
jgi:transposase-like protein